MRSRSGRTTPSAPNCCSGLPSRSTGRTTTARQQEALETARDALLAVGDTERASEAESFLARVFWERGEHDLVREHLARAEALAGDSVSAAAARVLAFAGRIREIAGEHGRRATSRRGRIRDGDRARARRAPCSCAHDDRHGEERRRPRVGRRRHGACPRDRSRGRLPGRLGDRQQPRRLRDVCGRLSTHGRALRRGDAPRRALRRRLERPLRPRQPHLARLHSRALGPRARVGGHVHRRMRGGVTAHARSTWRAKYVRHSGSPAAIRTLHFATSSSRSSSRRRGTSRSTGSARSQLPRRSTPSSVRSTKRTHSLCRCRRSFARSGCTAR